MASGCLGDPTAADLLMHGAMSNLDSCLVLQEGVPGLVLNSWCVQAGPDTNS